MSRISSPRLLNRRLAFALVGFILLLTQPGRAQFTTDIHFFKNYFVTGDYLAAGVGLRGTGIDGIATSQIHFTGTNIVPPNADIMAAFLYWETVTTANSIQGNENAQFRGHDIESIAVKLNPNGTAPCWSSGGATGGAEGAHMMQSWRADVLQFLGQKLDASGHPTGKRLVNDVDLTGLPGTALGPNEVKLPDAGNGNSVPSTAGATLLIVYRDPSKPLNSVVIYDGGYTIDQSHQTLSVNMQGFFQASTVSPIAKMTHIVGDGQTGFPEQVLVNGALQSSDFSNPFGGADGPASDRAWDTWTHSVSIGGDASSVTIDVNHIGNGSFDCLSWGAIIFGTTVQDTDFDGLLDRWETTSGLTDPDGQTLPDLPAMGANPNVQDLFVELASMGSTSGYSTPLGAVTAHEHMPSAAVIDSVTLLFRNAAPRPGIPCPGGFCPINVHWDLGTSYTGTIPSVGACNASWSPGCAIIRPSSGLARGGERIEETACTAPCQFTEFPGTVGWKTGFQILRDQPLPPYNTEATCVAAGAACRRRFDSNRFHAFKFGLIGHATGVPREDDPATPYNETLAPRSISGVADGGHGGGDFQVTLGFWGNNFKGTDFVQIATIAHEMGHTTSLRHGGGRPTPADPLVNCRPNYESVMNYMFQIRGIITSTGPITAFSKQRLNNLTENSLPEAAITDLDTSTAMTYPTRWFAPKTASMLDTLINTDPATRHCNGTPLSAAEETDRLIPGHGTVRIDGTSTGPMDWNANGLFSPSDLATLSQDINFNGTTNSATKDGTFTGFNDWQHMDLRQTASRRNRNGLSLEIEYTDVSGDEQPGFGDEQPGFGDEQPGYGDEQPGFGDEQPGFGDDLDFVTATAVGNPPNFLRYTTTNRAIILQWDPPHAGAALEYQVWKVLGAITPTNQPTKIYTTPATPQPPATTYSDFDTRNGLTYSYFVTVKVGAAPSTKQSGPSNIILATR